MKKPFLFAAAAALYIEIVVFVIDYVTSGLEGKSLVIPMVILGLFVLSAAIMGFLFLSEPIQLYMDNRKKEAVAFFGKTVAFFAGIVVIFLVVLLVS